MGFFSLLALIVWLSQSSFKPFSNEDHISYEKTDSPTQAQVQQCPPFQECKPYPSNTLSMVELRARYERIYQQNMDRTREYIATRYGGNFLNLIPWNPQEATYLWDLFPASYNCDERERIGRLSDGGKWLCRFRYYEKLEDCTVLSFGINGEYTFEIELLRRTKCRIFGFDASVNIPEAFLGNPRFTFVQKFLGPNVNATHTTLQEIVGNYSISKIDLIKMDIEGSEWDVISSWRKLYSVFPAPQFLVELHYTRNDQVCSHFQS